VKRRTLLKTALALPMVHPLAHATAIARTADTQPSATNALFSGLPGLDYALGGMTAGELLCVLGPQSTGKTLVLLDLASRICERYHQNVVLWSAHQPSVYLVRKMAIKGAGCVAFAEDTCFVDEWDRGVGDQPRVLVVSSSADSARAHGIANTLAGHPRGCAALVMDGWSTIPNRALDIEVLDGMAAFAAERWPHTPLSVTDLHHAKQFAQGNQMPIVMGVTTASIVDDQALAESFHLSTHIRLTADRLVTLHRPELYVETAHAIAADKNVVCLSGSSPRWWDTRCSRLRFEPRRLGYSTVI
jgi:KaiC/GvpD/RAD55 family RecA-like ATPase